MEIPDSKIWEPVNDIMTNFGKTQANNVIHDLDFLLFNSNWDQNGAAEDMMFQRKTTGSTLNMNTTYLISLFHRAF